MVLRADQRQHVLAVAQGEQARLLAVHELLDHHRGARCAELVAGKHVVRRVDGLLNRFGHDHALAGGEPVRLHHDGRAP